MFFETYFNLEGLEGEQKVCCPYPHRKANGQTYKDGNPSCCINLDKRVFHCLSCGEKGSEADMVAHVFGCTTQKAYKFLSTLNAYKVRLDDMVEQQWEEYSDKCIDDAESLGMDVSVLRDMNVCLEENEGRTEYEYPVTWEGWVVDIRRYRPGCSPKVVSEKGAQTGLIIPYDIWKAEPEGRWTIICAGEKDMTVTRSRGFNAITLTGGEVASPLAPVWFKDRKVAICYDNDWAGLRGAKSLAEKIAPYTKELKVVTGFHKDFNGDDTKEDLTDWFTKYGGTADKLKQIIKETPLYEYVEETVDETLAPLVRLDEAVKSEHVGDTLRSQIQLLTTSEHKYEIPKRVKIKKFASDKGKMKEGESLFWSIDDEGMAEVIFQLAGKSKENQFAAIKKAMGMGAEKGLAVFVQEYVNLYVCQVVDVVSTDMNGTETIMYFLGDDPSRYQKLMVTYLRMNNPENGEVGMIATDWGEAQGDIDSFEVTEHVKNSLMYIKHNEGTVADKVQHRAEAVRGLLGYEANLNLITAIDMCFNSVKEFNYGNQKNVKGFIDCLVVGESRVGKSDTAKRLQTVYQLGSFISLAGSAATIPGIVGGSVQDAMGRRATRAGAIPRNHGGLICFEELAKSERDVLKSLTDIRSSGLARITRVSGSLELPAALRMCTLTNVKPVGNGETRPIASYSSGVEIVKDLVGTAEDIARYDYVYIQGDDGVESDPLYMAPEPIPADILQDAIRWVWSRKPNQIIMDRDTEVYLSERCKALNHKYPLHIKLFGTECWKKMCRLAIACAGYVVSTDEEYENIIVTKEHVDWAATYLEDIYNNPTFKLQVLVDQTLKQTQVNEKDTRILQSKYIKYKDSFDYLNAMGKVDKGTFKDLSNIEGNNMSAVIRALTTMNFITVDSNYIYSTTKYRNTYALLNKEVSVEEV